MYKALYREYRPQTFDEVLGQEHVVKILKNQIESGSVAHAYLFCGTRGTGKTTMARLLAKGVNCLSDNAPCGECENCNAIKNGSFLDVIEIDAASNNGVDNIRDLRESVNYPPVLGRKKVYIIDEVHMLSTGAFNALLKTLEEPPEDVIFILATTEPQKLPATIMSRCLTLDFKRVTEKKLVEGMKKICLDLKIKVADEALQLIARNADGSVRDGLSILDQCLAAGEKKVSYEDVLELLGTVGDNALIDIADLIIEKNTKEVLILLTKFIDDGKEMRELTKEFLRHYRNLLVCKYVDDPAEMLEVSKENAKRIKEQANKITLPELHKAIFLLSGTLNEIKWSSQPRVLLELALVQLSEGESECKEKEAASSNKAKAKPSVKMKESQRDMQEAKQKKEDVREKLKGESEKQAADNKSPAQTVTKGTLVPEYAKLWAKICDEYGKENATFHYLANSAELWEITDTNFVIAALNPVTQKTLEGTRASIEEGMKKFGGISLPMLCKLKAVLETAEGEKKNVDIEKTKKVLEKKLNLDIEII